MSIGVTANPDRRPDSPTTSHDPEVMVAKERASPSPRCSSMSPSTAVCLTGLAPHRPGSGLPRARSAARNRRHGGGGRMALSAFPGPRARAVPRLAPGRTPGDPREARPRRRRREAARAARRRGHPSHRGARAGLRGAPITAIFLLRAAENPDDDGWVVDRAALSTLSVCLPHAVGADGQLGKSVFDDFGLAGEPITRRPELASAERPSGRRGRACATLLP